MNEDILAAVIGHDKAESFVEFVPLHGSHQADFGTSRSRPTARTATILISTARSAGRDRDHARDLDDARNLRTFLPWRHQAQHLGAIGNFMESGAIKDGDVQKSIRTTIALSHEPKALARIEPLNHNLSLRSFIVRRIIHTVRQDPFSLNQD